jgi:hypothetical protein
LDYKLGIKYLKKAANYSHKTQKLLYLADLAEEYYQKRKIEKLQKTLKRLGEIDILFEIVLSKYYDDPYEIEEHLKSEAVSKLRKY